MNNDGLVGNSIFVPATRSVVVLLPAESFRNNYPLLGCINPHGVRGISQSVFITGQSLSTLYCVF
jgi:hypothetical protein